MLKRMVERDHIDRAAAEDFYGIVWQLVRKAIHEIPDVLDAMASYRHLRTRRKEL